jgi:hypothetical protein
MMFLLGFASGVLTAFGAVGLLVAFVSAAWRDGIVRHLNGRPL